MDIFQRVKEIVFRFYKNEADFSRNMDVAAQTMNTWFKQKNEAKMLLLLKKILSCHTAINRDWLYFGEGEMLKTQKEQIPPTTVSIDSLQKISSVPVLGFASCSIIGWSGEMTIPMAATAPHVTPRTIAVMASGESMIPAGIGHGHICFCEPDLEPLRGDIVYVRRKDELGTLKTFLGWGMEAGIPEATKGELCLRGWSDRDEIGRQRELIITVDKILIKTVAPVVFVRRRM